MVGSRYLRTIFIVANCFALLDVGLQYSSSFDYKNIASRFCVDILIYRYNVSKINNTSQVVNYVQNVF